jgi:hypothetical protein
VHLAFAGMWFQLSGCLQTKTRRPKGLRAAAFKWALHHGSYRIKDDDGIWYDGFQGITVDESDDVDETLSLRFLLFFNDETKSAQAHADLFDPRHGAFGLYHVERGEEPVVREVTGPMASYVAVKVSDYERNFDRSPPESMSARSDSVSSYHIDDKVKAHSMKYQNLTPAAGQELVQHMHLISNQFTSRDKKRKASRDDEDPAADIPFVDHVKTACLVPRDAPLLWEHVRKLDRDSNNFLYAWQPFHQLFDNGDITVLFDEQFEPRQVDCEHPKDDPYVGYEVAVIIKILKPPTFDISQVFGLGTKMIHFNQEYQAFVTVKSPDVFRACLAWKAQEGDQLRSERANTQ